MNPLAAPAAGRNDVTTQTVMIVSLLAGYYLGWQVRSYLAGLELMHRVACSMRFAVDEAFPSLQERMMRHKP